MCYKFEGRSNEAVVANVEPTPRNLTVEAEKS